MSDTIPAWAISSVRSMLLGGGDLSDECLARLLVKTRADALREAARLSAGPFAKAIYALIDREPGSIATPGAVRSEFKEAT